MSESKLPRSAPWPTMHAAAYLEQEGSKRQIGPRVARMSFESVIW
ncbi:Hypothetical protein CAP_5532 [Chondromyces apiculatus DSM 436]|uniref:Uncharacterized protein n=1 Tax=Chondromyces apiculatus DSM 436 TaxID=1192034 RepID=A0A017T2W4_9BACT|nr:Hypothetical protein CAP_5532 [Chondromyces apiculatus DSM 436]